MSTLHSRRGWLVISVGLLLILPFSLAAVQQRNVRYDTRQRAAEGDEEELETFGATGEEVGLTGQLKLVSLRQSYSVGEQFNVDILVDTGGQYLAGAQIKINYNPQLLELVSVKPGKEIDQSPPMLTQILRQVNEGGVISLDVGVAVPNPVPYRNVDSSHLGIYGRLRFKVLAAGSTNISFQLDPGRSFSAQSKGDTDLLVLRGSTVYDILGGVQDLSLTLNQATTVCNFVASQKVGTLRGALGRQPQTVSFVPSQTGVLRRISIKAGSSQAGEKRITCQIMDAGGQSLSGEVDSPVFTQDSGAAWRSVKLSDKNISLQSGQTYQISCRGSDEPESLYWVYDQNLGKTYLVYLCSPVSDGSFLSQPENSEGLEGE